MDLVRINEVADRFGVSSRTLRYYEEVGILWSSHPDWKAQRYYDAAALERLKQIVILRKLQIPVKDIVTIFKSEGTTALIQAFADKLASLDTEITALSELRRLVDDFLGKMLSSGIKKISAITLLYEETEKRLSAAEKEEKMTFEQLSKISRNALTLRDIRVIRLPSMRMLTSRLKTGQMENLDGDKMQNLFVEHGLLPRPGLRNCFYRKETGGEWLMLIKISNNYENKTAYADEMMTGGLYAVASTFMEDLEDTFVLLRDWLHKNEPYEMDVDANGYVNRFEMIEEILPWDIANTFNRYQQDIFIPIRLKNRKELP